MQNDKRTVLQALKRDLLLVEKARALDAFGGSECAGMCGNNTKERHRPTGKRSGQISWLGEER